ncbi:pyridoxamine 5'-phosphate oxidase family protein [Muricauda sp. SCSIO 64092]|uniref:pyridoxamine 5'-phosphate oxidase family protein n=1 Tax=Allomuricauda sp. SCSIO 64092 TaxID=2908842 RepID=UPI001FF15450|nr:pyridoxamine 5'-phosphate oxidase family protein [Muricauda sp. SCSIO 64092]UOY05926.1 pyridoxamine 5'-phosphate oxidase family protein [Muricauda sp. SCSIO 64092]
MDQLIFQQIKNELINGSVKKGHPFKYFALGTLSGNIPCQRTVVLRKVQPNLQLLFYTDKRSPKVEQIHRNNTVSALFYHPKKMIQLQVEGKADIKENPEMLRKIWKSIPAKSRKDYTTVLPPGIKIDQPDGIEYLTESDHFCMVEIQPTRIEYLKLKQPYHLRVEFLKMEGEWSGTFLIP